MATYYGTKVETSDLALYLDAGNYKSYSTNTFQSPLDLYTWYVTKRGNNTGNACTVEQDFSTSRSPAGGIPMKMNVTGDDPHIGSYNAATWNISAASNGQTWRISFYAKASTTLNNCEVYIFGANSSGVSFVSGSWLGITSKTITVTTNWQRFDHFITFNNADIAFIHMRLDGPNTGGSGTTVWWDGLQVERTSAVTPFKSFYNPNGTSWFNQIGSNTATLTNNPSYDIANGGSLLFDGVDDHAPLSSAISAKTILSWIKLSTAAGGDYVVYGLDANGSDNWFGVNGNRVSFFGTQSSDVNNFSIQGTTTLSTSLWYQIGCTIDGATAKVFLNGVEENSTTRAFTIGAWNTAPTIGRRGGIAQRYFPGNIATVTVFDRVLTSTQIKNNFDTFKGRFGI